MKAGLQVLGLQARATVLTAGPIGVARQAVPDVKGVRTRADELKATRKARAIDVATPRTGDAALTRNVLASPTSSLRPHTRRLLAAATAVGVATPARPSWVGLEPTSSP